MNELYHHLFQILAPLIGHSKFGAREMLLAYVDFWSASTKGGTASTRLQLKGIDLDSEEIIKISREYLHYDVFSFITQVLGRIAQPQKWYRLFHSYNVPSIVINLLMLEKLVGEDDLISVKKASTKRLLDRYKNNVSRISYDGFHPIQDADFEEAFWSIFATPLNSQAKRIDDSQSAIKTATRLAATMNNDLQMPKSEQVKLCFFYYCKQYRPSEIASRLHWSSFVPLSDAQRINQVSGLCRELAGIRPLDIICAIYLSKKNTYQNDLIAGERASTRQEQYNNVVLETGIVYSSFFSSILLPYGSKKSAAVFFPSPLFIQQVSKDKDLKDFDIIIVLDDANLVDLLNLHFNRRLYSGSNGANLHFVSLREYADQYADEMPFTHILYFQHEDTALTEELIYSSFYDASRGTSLFALTADYEESDRISLFTESVNSSKVIIDRVMLIPTGIAGTTHPRKKTFWQAHIASSGHELSSTVISAPHFAIRFEDRNEAGYLLSNPAICHYVNSFRSETATGLRGKYASVRREVPDNRKRKAPLRFQFSPEISVYCNVSNSSDTDGLMRCTAYVESIDAHGRTTGKKLTESEKSKGTIKADDVENWALSDYLFSTKTVRSNGRQHQTVSIREIIADNYSPMLEHGPISLLTFWFLHPELEDQFTSRSYEAISALAQGALGFSRLDLITDGAICEQLYDSVKSKTELYQRLNDLSRFFDFAIENGHMAVNPLNDMLRGNKRFDKYYLKMREGLTKKSFNRSEVAEVYRHCLNALNNGSRIHLGLLIRLFTGIDANSVCALTWADYLYDEDYGVHFLSLFRELTNDGKSEKEYPHDYEQRLVPCSRLLEGILSDRLAHLKRKYPDFAAEDSYIVCSSDAKSNAPVSPILLQQTCRELIVKLDIQDLIIDVPDFLGGSRETNLSRYQGDIFRSNLEYWLNDLKVARDDINYILGRQRELTHNHYYCDFKYAGCGYRVYVDLCRLDSLLMQTTSEENRITLPTTSQPVDFGGNSPSPVECTFEISADAAADIEIRSDCDVRLLVKGVAREK